VAPASAIFRSVDEGQPIAYQMLEEGVVVLSSDGKQVGKVGAVLSAPEKDVFHGLLVETPDRGVRFVEAAAIASIHERGVDLRIDASEAGSLPLPEHAAPVFEEDPSKQERWRHWVQAFTGRGDWDRER
jgi:hypothetical protein